MLKHVGEFLIFGTTQNKKTCCWLYNVCIYIYIFIHMIVYIYILYIYMYTYSRYLSHSNPRYPHLIPMLFPKLWSVWPRFRRSLQTALRQLLSVDSRCAQTTYGARNGKLLGDIKPHQPYCPKSSSEPITVVRFGKREIRTTWGSCI